MLEEELYVEGSLHCLEQYLCQQTTRKHLSLQLAESLQEAAHAYHKVKKTEKKKREIYQIYFKRNRKKERKRRVPISSKRTELDKATKTNNGNQSKVEN